MKRILIVLCLICLLAGGVTSYGNDPVRFSEISFEWVEEDAGDWIDTILLIHFKMLISPNTVYAVDFTQDFINWYFCDAIGGSPTRETSARIWVDPFFDERIDDQRPMFFRLRELQ